VRKIDEPFTHAPHHRHGGSDSPYERSGTRPLLVCPSLSFLADGGAAPLEESPAGLLTMLLLLLMLPPPSIAPLWRKGCYSPRIGTTAESGNVSLLSRRDGNLMTAYGTWWFRHQ
jgi:hypothetical protein